MNVPIAVTMARVLVHFEMIRSVNEGAMRTPCLKIGFFAYLTLTFDPFILQSGFC